MSSSRTPHTEPAITVVGVGAWLGFLFGTVAKIALCFTMLGVFVVALVF